MGRYTSSGSRRRGSRRGSAQSRSRPSPSPTCDQKARAGGGQAGSGCDRLLVGHEQGVSSNIQVESNRGDKGKACGRSRVLLGSAAVWMALLRTLCCAPLPSALRAPAPTNQGTHEILAVHTAHDCVDVPTWTFTRSLCSHGSGVQATLRLGKPGDQICWLKWPACKPVNLGRADAKCPRSAVQNSMIALTLTAWVDASPPPKHTSHISVQTPRAALVQPSPPAPLYAQPCKFTRCWPGGALTCRPPVPPRGSWTLGFRSQ